MTGVRTLSEDSMPIAISNAFGLLKVLPAGVAGDIQEFKFYIPFHPGFSRRDFKLNVDSLIYFSRDAKYLGEFDFSSSWGTSWRVFSKSDGTVLGHTKNLYLPRGVLPTRNDVETYDELSCNTTQEMRIRFF